VQGRREALPEGAEVALLLSGERAHSEIVG
jgi:hypothetical protein